MTETRFVCRACGSVFSEGEARLRVVDPEQEAIADEISCPNCGSALVEPDHFDPDGPLENPLEPPDEAAQG